MYNYFSLRRVLFILRNDILSDYKSWLIYLLAIVGVYTGISLLEGAAYKFSGSLSEPDNLNNLFPGFLFLGGFITSSMAFSDVNDKFKSSLWLTLPGSTLEKYISGVIISGIGYVVFLITAFIVASVVGNIFSRPIFGFGLAIFNPFTLSFGHESVWSLSLYYLLLQSIFIVGSIVFRKAAFIKTIFTVFAVQLVLSIIFSFIGYLFVKLGADIDWDLGRFLFFNYAPESIFNLVSQILLITCGILFIFFNIVGYLKLREKEVKGGV